MRGQTFLGSSFRLQYIGIAKTYCPLISVGKNYSFLEPRAYNYAVLTNIDMAAEVFDNHMIMEVSMLDFQEGGRWCENTDLAHGGEWPLINVCRKRVAK